MNIVARICVDSYELEDLMKALRKGIELIGGLEIQDDMNIAIKLNLSDLCPPETGVTSHPRFIEALINILRQKANVKIYLVESDHWAATADEEFEYLGYTELAKKCNVALINLSKDKKIEVQIDGKHLKRLKVPLTLLFADKFISVSKMKTHVNECITCVLKNQFGLLPQRQKSRFHPYLSEVLADLNSLYRPDLCIVDGIVGMEGQGPTIGTTRKFGVIILGKDPVATDATAAKTMGFNSKKIPHLKFAENSRVGTFNFLVTGDSVEFKKVQFIPSLAYKFFRIKLFFDRHNHPEAAKLFHLLGQIWSSEKTSRAQKLKIILGGVARRIAVSLKIVK